MSDAPADTKPTEETKTVTEQATEVASTAATTAAEAATAVKDNVFSMFGGGPKKEKKEEADEKDVEPSGSSKAAKKDEGVSHDAICAP